MKLSPADYVKVRTRRLSELVTKKRLAVGVTQAELADVIGSTRARVGRIEDTGTDVWYSFAELELLFPFLGISSDLLLMREQEHSIVAALASMTYMKDVFSVPRVANLGIEGKEFLVSKRGLALPGIQGNMLMSTLLPDIKFSLSGEVMGCVISNVGHESFVFYFWSCLTGTMIASYLVEGWVSDIFLISNDGSQFVYFTEESLVFRDLKGGKVVSEISAEVFDIDSDSWRSRADEVGAELFVVGAAAFSVSGKYFAFISERFGVLYILYSVEGKWQIYRTINIFGLNFAPNLSRRALDSEEFYESSVSSLYFAVDDSVVYLSNSRFLSGESDAAVLLDFRDGDEIKYQTVDKPGGVFAISVLYPLKSKSVRRLEVVAGDQGYFDVFERDISYGRIVRFLASSSKLIASDVSSSQLVFMGLNCILALGYMSGLKGQFHGSVPVLRNLVSGRSCLCLVESLTNKVFLSPCGRYTAYWAGSLEDGVDVCVQIRDINHAPFLIKGMSLAGDLQDEYPVLSGKSG